MKHTLLFILLATTAVAQSNKTRFVTYQITDTVWTITRDTVVDGSFYDNDKFKSVGMYGVNFNPGQYKAKQITKSGGFVSSNYIRDPFAGAWFDESNNALQNKRTSYTYTLTMPYKAKATHVHIMQVDAILEKKIRTDTLKQFDFPK